MKTSKWVSQILVILILGMMVLSLKAQEIDYFTPRNVKRFAHILYQNKDYSRAIGEYQRLLALTLNFQDSIYYRIANCFENQGTYKTAKRYYEKVVLHHDSKLSDYSHYQIALNYYFQKQYQQSICYIESHTEHIQNDDLLAEMEYLKGINLIYLDQWTQAHSLFYIGAKQYKRQKFRRAAQFAAGNSELLIKKPWLAGLMSTVLPGSGKIYTDHKGDAFYTMMVLSLTGYLAYDGIRDEKSTKICIFGTMFTGFYLGNIYGSIISAKVYNEKKRKCYLECNNFQLRIFNEIPF